MFIRASIIVVLSFTVCVPFASGEPATPVELGGINWRRNYDLATVEARTKNKPLLVLFQEVPGCGTCVGYGQDVLSHPLIIEAAETHFVPVAMYNNVEGHDKKILDYYKEKAWNNPVVRIVSPDRTALAPKLAEDYTLGGLATTMVQAMTKLNRAVPPYLQLLADETGARKHGLERATFAMHCFWEGEAALGNLDGTVSTLPGFVGKLEVVDVEFDPRVITYESLLKKAQQAKCASHVFVHNEKQKTLAAKLVGDEVKTFDGTVRPDKEPKYYLTHSPYRFVPMTPLQAARVNAGIHLQQDPSRSLSPRQLRILRAATAKPDLAWVSAVGEGMIQAWPTAWNLAKQVTTAEND